MSLFQNSGNDKKNCKKSLSSFTTSCEPSKNTEYCESFYPNQRRSVTFSPCQQKDSNSSTNINSNNLQIENNLPQSENCNLICNPISTNNQTQKTGKSTFYKNFNPFHKTPISKNLFNNDDERLPLKATEVINQPSAIDRHQDLSTTTNNNNISEINSKKLSNQESNNSKFTNFFLNRKHSPLRPLIKPIDNIEKLGPKQPSSTALLPKVFGIRHSLAGGSIY
ncbi:Hypothetical protein SRAE_X000162800 [Strongyloides ratti]|uniref:Uncharacterized protein n=1 Tax=Strongyloides ratti TaxID=34506 RepID=A0A090KR82_STRRB|nr:Hypothetical protein SRAE_X000162800 [Strongyloides ratti]CEF59884.1 Hypothetical protein SRAE_X000162800 [Strongyloides ratti]